MTAQPAFTAVAARRTLAKDTPADSNKPTNFASTVVDYVQRSFFEFNRQKEAPALAGITDKDIRNKLSIIVNKATEAGVVNSRDWANFPLPHEHILDDRRQSMYAAQNAVIANLLEPSMEPQFNGAHASGPNAKKRKSLDQEMTDAEGQPVTPPWKKKTNAKATLAERMTGKSKHQDKKRKDNNTWFDTSADALERRRQRFAQSPEPSPYISSRDDSPAVDANSGPIVGTCQTLEKNYFRLTAPPNPSTVRPLPVLEKALDYIMTKWKSEHDYTYTCDQLKSLRQDLTVQRIKSPFTIRVYETHARIALQMKDLGEYNQCQTQLRALYKLRLGEGGSSGGKEDEFLAYRILYLIYTRNRTDMNNMLADLTTADKKGTYVSLALRVRAALASGNYHRFFQLYRQYQDRNMVPYLMDMFIDRERLGAMAAICKSYKPDVSSKFLTKELAFTCSDTELFDEDVERECLSFVVNHGSDALVQEKDGGDVRVLTGKAGNIFEMAKQAAFGKVDIKGQI
ncbi:hypothetical protein M409DRAFT_68159 [Zasmidium cellare ATCC 36951]|uniref:SAC3/GANP/THP3 conserved domain-containing protein n=1 Tax=Zasmidium cellare ATCC 36951 TaxID=1080233 RepID=A0A6A6C9N2_ZASCE|nr:uncharacterized protein M409DRAFT_68159 [Zasmidium cellare ATCC 36951]KAF2163897.1 hypothetical protein M409DRAFT_68159 [Zasmidium cellare ATCC 36951]